MNETKRPIIPPAVRMALLVALNHVEPGWENCVTIAKAWIDEPNDPHWWSESEVQP